MRGVPCERCLVRYQGALIVDEQQNLKGIITLSDVLLAVEQHTESEITVLEAGSTDLIVTYPDELLRVAVAKMLNNEILEQDDLDEGFVLACQSLPISEKVAIRYS